jgi:glycine dehydrogenase
LTAKALAEIGFEQTNKNYFDTIKIKTDSVQQSKIKAFAVSSELNFRYEEGAILLSFDEVKTVKDVKTLVEVFAKSTNQKIKSTWEELGRRIGNQPS